MGACCTVDDKFSGLESHKQVFYTTCRLGSNPVREKPLPRHSYLCYDKHAVFYNKIQVCSGKRTTGVGPADHWFHRCYPVPGFPPVEYGFTADDPADNTAGFTSAVICSMPDF